MPNTQFNVKGNIAHGLGCISDSQSIYLENKWYLVANLHCSFVVVLNMMVTQPQVRILCVLYGENLLGKLIYHSKQKAFIWRALFGYAANQRKFSQKGPQLDIVCSGPASWSAPISHPSSYPWAADQLPDRQSVLLSQNIAPLTFKEKLGMQRFLWNWRKFSWCLSLLGLPSRRETS